MTEVFKTLTPKLIDQLARSDVFRALPLENVGLLLSKSSPVTVTKGQQVVCQYAKANSYYIIVEGYAEVWSEDLDDDEPVLKRLVGPGDGFEEEAMILRGGRTSTVIMQCDGVLLRIGHEDFNALVAGPLVEKISAEETMAKLQSGARLLDVRFEEEHEECHIPGSTLIPLPQLRDRIGELDEDAVWLVYCKHDQRAVTATCLLRQQGLMAKTVLGGIVDWPYATSAHKDELELISLDYCPYVQRTQIMLEHNNIPYKLTYIDPDNKPDWFHEVSPLGKVPVLRVNGDSTIFESTVINEFIHELAGGNMLPKDPVDRTICRSWIEYAGVCQGGLLRMVAAPTKAAFDEAFRALEQCISNVEQQLDADGPYFGGSALSLVDATFAPFFIRLDSLATIVPVPELSSRMRQWSAALCTHDAVRRSTPDAFEEVFDRFVVRKGQGGYVDGFREKPLQLLAAQ